MRVGGVCGMFDGWLSLGCISMRRWFCGGALELTWQFKVSSFTNTSLCPLCINIVRSITGQFIYQYSQ